MKYIGNIFKISIILLLLVVCIGLVSASDSSDVFSDDYEDIDDYDFEDSSFDDDSDDSDLDDDLDEDDYDDSDLDDDLEDNESDYQFDEFEYLKYKITSYLTKYGNDSEENWTNSTQFLYEYEIYLSNPSNYTLNKSSEGYETYLKIFDSITATFNDYNLTQNQTDYLKFMIIYYLNYYGNVSDNYTWNESDDFSKFEPSVIVYALSGSFFGSASAPEDHIPYSYSNLNKVFSKISNNSTDNNSTAVSNNSSIAVSDDSLDWNNIILIILLVILLMFVII